MGYMTYTTNPQLPKVRRQAVNLVRKGWSTRQVARHFGFHQSTIVRWVNRAPTDGRMSILTHSSRPHSHPKALSHELAQAIVNQRLKHGRCAEVIQQELINQGYQVSLSSVKRILKRRGLIKERSPWKRYHKPKPRPKPVKPGDLVQVDTIHILVGKLYVYTLLDVYSRWAWALPSLKINTHLSLKFVRDAQRRFGLPFQVLQSDHGSEFSTYFSEQIKIQHRHSRVRKPNDNGHLERFNRTIQDECLKQSPKSLKVYQEIIPSYINYYNTERLHLGINLKTPEVMRSY
jgi:transposase InsO family protein